MSRSIPQNRMEMERAGYKLRGNGLCKGCGAEIAWYRTTNNKSMPFNLPIVDDRAEVVPHWATCPKRDDFKSKADIARDKAEMRTGSVQDLLELTGARAVVALFEEGQIVSWRTGLDGDELRQEAITGANKLKWAIMTNQKERG